MRTTLIICIACLGLFVSGCMMPDPEKAAAANEVKLAKEGLVRPEIGAQAPPLMTRSAAGQAFDLSSQLAEGRYTVLFFYPVNGAPNVTKHLLALKTAAPALQERDVDVYAVNPGASEEGQSFFSKYSISLPLLDDPGHAIAKALGCALPDGVIPQRTLVGIAPDGKIAMFHRGFPAGADPSRYILKQLGLEVNGGEGKPTTTTPETKEQEPAQQPPAGGANTQQQPPAPPNGAKPPAAPGGATGG